jgi:PA domain
MIAAYQCVQDEGFDVVEKQSKDSLYIRYLKPHILVVWRTLSAQTVYGTSDISSVQQASVTHAVITSTSSGSSTYCVLSTVNSDSTTAVSCMAAAFGTLTSSTLAPSYCDLHSSSSGDACADSGSSADSEQVPTDYTLQAPLRAAPKGDATCCTWLSLNSIITGISSSSADRAYEGAILLVQRGDCQFAEKARIAAAGGAAALIIVNTANAPANDAMFVMHGFDAESMQKSDTALRKRCARRVHSNQYYCAGVLDNDSSGSSSSSDSSSGAAVSIPVVLVSHSAGAAMQQQLQQQRAVQLQVKVTTLNYAAFDRSPYYAPIVSRSISSSSSSSSDVLIGRESPYSLQVFSTAAAVDEFSTIVSITGSESWGLALARNDQHPTVDPFVFDAADTESDQYLWEQQHQQIFSK